MNFAFQLDKIGLGGSTKGKKGSQLSRPHSETDFGDIPEINEPPLTEKQVLEQFDKMLDDMNLTDEKKIPLNSTSIENKRKMLSTYIRGSSAYNTVSTHSVWFSNFKPDNLTANSYIPSNQLKTDVASLCAKRLS
jgi:hypothetical protein